MATDEEIFRIVAQVQGQADVERLTVEIQKQEDKIRLLTAELRLGAITQAQFAMRAKLAASAINQMTGELRKAAGAAGGGGLTTAIGQIGYAVDDLQYGFRGIANNIQPILTSIPGLAGLAGPISIAAIAAFQFYEHWDKILGLFGLGVPQPALTGLELLTANIKKASDEMEELKKKTNLEWYELKRLKELQEKIPKLTKEAEQQKAVDEAGKSTSDAEKEAGAGFAKAVAESGGARSISEIQGAIADQKDAKGLVYNTVTGNMTTPEVAARDMTAAALKGDRVARDAIKAALAKNSSLGAKIDEFSPEQKAADEKSMTGLDKEEGLEDTDKFIRDLRRERKRKAEDKLKKDAREASKGFDDRFAPAILNNVARGNANDPAALTAAVARDMKGQGRTQEEIDRLSPAVAKMLLEQIEGRIKERAAEQGIGREEAAAREAEDDTASARSKAKKATGTTGDLAGFAGNLQQALFNKADPVQTAILEENRKTADRLEKLLEETRKVKPRNQPNAVAAGPG